MRNFFLLLLLTSLLFSQELILDNLLKEYEDSASLYKKTKKESAGYLLVYSRSDLDRMQAYSLRDVLKTIRMYTTQINRTGAVGILNAGAGKTSMPPLKLYIDDFEVSTVVQRNALDMYGDMDIYFVDHIEVYQGGSSLAFGNELGSMVIRLYSKDPNRENSTSFQLGVDSKAGVNLRAMDAGTMGEYNYLFYANAAKTEYDKYSRDGYELSRDGMRYQAHFKISNDDDFSVELDGIFNKNDIFNGFGSAPTGDNTTRAFGYINAIKYFPGNVEVSISASQEDKEVYNTDDKGITLMDGNDDVSNNMHIDVRSNTFKTAIKKKIISGNSDLLIGAEIQKKVIQFGEYTGFSTPIAFGPDEVNIYMLYLEELYNIDKNHLLTFSAKYDRYENSFDKKSNEYSLRVGYIGIFDNDWSTKVFAIKRYVHPNMIQTSFAPPSYTVNPDLDGSDINMLSGEVEYMQDKNRLVVGFAYKEIDNAINLVKVSPGKMMYDNKDETNYFHRYYIRGEHNFDLDNKIIVEIYKAFKEIDGSPDSGGLVQIFNSFDKFDIYNELVYRSGVSFIPSMGGYDIDPTYDYTLSVAYHMNKNLSIKAKGENLLDKATNSALDKDGLIQIPAIERRGILTMEYTF